MRRLTIATVLTLDGVMQAPGRPGGKSHSAIEYGSCALDEPRKEEGERRKALGVSAR